MNTEELLKTLKLEKDQNYLVFVSKESGISASDLAGIPLHDMGTGRTYFVLVSGNVAELVKTVEVK